MVSSISFCVVGVWNRNLRQINRENELSKVLKVLLTDLRRRTNLTDIIN